jgi:5-oxoprolinase (ATP-hydrolysing)
MTATPNDKIPVIRIGVDIGGTFTDIVAAHQDGRVFVEKNLSSVHDYSESIAVGIQSILKRADVAAAAVYQVVHGTTVATNAILEGRGARSALITTRGFRDVLDMRHSRRPDMYDINWVKPPALIDRYLRLEVDERLSSRGEVIRPLDLKSVDAVVTRLLAENVESVAVCLINSFSNSAHERKIGELVRQRMPNVSLSLSCDVLPEAKEYERTSTTCINAYVRPVVENYLNNLGGRLSSMGIDGALLTMQSNGGIISARAAAEKPIHIVESGPAAGVMGALALSRDLKIDKAITFDMGGTTAKAALIENGEVRFTIDLEVGAGLSAVSRLNKGGGYALSTPSVDVAEVGVGGGSIAWIDEGKAIRVGPHSAGAKPGPVFYGLGGKSPTVTDANAVLGYLNPNYLVGGDLKVDIAAARRVIETTLAQPLNMSVEEAAYGVHAVANAGMTRAIRSISTERGRDPRDAALIAFGGNGPVHAAGLARTLGMKRVVIPPAPGVFSAVGLLRTSIEHTYSKMVLQTFAAANADGLNHALAEFRKSSEADIAAAGYEKVRVEWLVSVDLRYRDQASYLTTKLPTQKFDPEVFQGMRQSFEDEHARTFGFKSPEEVVEIVSMRLTGRIRVAGSENSNPAKYERHQSTTQASKTLRSVYFGPSLGFLDTPVHDRAGLAECGVQGPAIIEQYDTTIVVPPAAAASLDEHGNIVIDLEPIVSSELADKRFDAVTRELVRHGLESLADEMALTLVRTCRSGHVKHSGDFSTAIADAQGQLLAQGITLPFHLGGMPDAFEAVLKGYKGRIDEGDVFAMNDPFNGGMHLPDIFLFKPIFHSGAMVAMGCAVVHHVDVGGRSAGGNSTQNTETYAEGLRLPVLKLMEKGVFNEAVLDIIRANVRVPTKVIGDLRAQISACERGENDYLDLIKRYGIDNLLRYQAQLLDATELVARESIRSIPDGVYAFEDYMDGDSVDPERVTMKVSVTVKDDEATIDCTGSSPQVRGAINATLSATKSMAYTALRCLMPTHTSTNSGYMRPIHVIAPAGGVLNCVLPAATAGRAATGYRLMDTIFGALAKALPGRIMAAGDGSPIMFSIGGYDEERKPFVFVDLMRGSWGARPHADGLDGTALAVSTGSSIPAELVELEHPVRLEYCGYVTDTPGAGHFRGGMAVMRQYRLLAKEASLQYRSERRKYHPYGLDGGQHGSASIVVWNPEGEHRLLPEKGEIRMKQGDVIRFFQASGGGYGDPFTRDAEQVCLDVRNQLISEKAARAHYGVAVNTSAWTVNKDETLRLRKAAPKRNENSPKIEVVPVSEQALGAIVEKSKGIRYSQ